MMLIAITALGIVSATVALWKPTTASMAFAAIINAVCAIGYWFGV